MNSANQNMNSSHRSDQANACLTDLGARNYHRIPSSILNPGPNSSAGRHGAIDGAYGHQMDYNSGLYQWSSLPSGLSFISQAEWQQTGLNYPPSLSFPWHGRGSVAWNSNFAPCPYPATYGHVALADMWLQPRQSNLAQDPNFLGPNISGAGHHLRSLGMPHASQFMEAELYRDHLTMSCPYPAPYGHVTVADMLLQPGQSNLRRNPLFSGSLVSQAGPYLRGLGLPHASHFMEAGIGRSHGTMSEELHQDIPNAHHFVDLQTQAMPLYPYYYRHCYPYGYLEEMMLEQLRRLTELRADSLSYEAFSALEEHIGSVRTGLTEETITELLKQKIYDCAISNNPSSDAETCCICREEYVCGEEIGELNCGHEFHTACIKQWLVLKNTCPICTRRGLGE